MIVIVGIPTKTHIELSTRGAKPVSHWIHGRGARVGDVCACNFFSRDSPFGV